jgi:FAD/FMN-containing dehydrogenase/Fe-S oxidoreductase
MSNDPHELPFNYTSAGDRQVAELILGSRAWELLQALREQSITGRSSKLILRTLGELFLLHRNPYLREELIASPHRLRTFRRSVGRDLAVVERYVNHNPDILELLTICREAVKRHLGALQAVPAQRKRIRSALGAVIGPENVSFEPFALVSHATDATDWRLHLPIAVARPRNEEQVGPLVRAIASLGLRIIPRGGGTGLTGGAIPVANDCVVINTEALNRIEPVVMASQVGDPAGPRIPVLGVGAGVITKDAMDAAAAEEWIFATDPTSAWASTIGGNIAENAGGKKAVLWGTAIDNLFSFRIVLPDGRHWSVHRVHHPLRKILPGDEVLFQVWNENGRFVRAIRLKGNEIRKPGLWKDITNKALGGVPGLQKEGTDGIITSARFILHRPYPLTRTFCIEFFGPTMEEAGRVILELARAFENRGEEVLMALEHFDDEYVRAIHYRTKAPRGESPKAVLLLDLVGYNTAQIEQGTARLEEILARFPGSFLVAARDESEGEQFWADRKKLGAIARRTNAFKLNEDVVLPLDRLAEYCAYLEEVNVAEERYTHGKIATAVREEVVSRGLLEGDDRLREKREPALALCQELAAASPGASRETLRRGDLLGGFASGMRGLLAGYDDVLARIKQVVDAERNRRIVVASHMHAGDGNVHVNIPVFSNDLQMMRRAAVTADRAMRYAVGLGGSVSGEHGIGVTKFRHLDPVRAEELKEYRRSVDPHGIMNPGKLSDPLVPDLVFTPSFNLLELEARILRHASLEALADKVSRCVRCGKCKADCCVFSPAGTMFYHPRNKNLAIGALVEALLYDVQRHRSTSFELLRHLREISDHCTICHKCLAPCPVDIDTGEVSLLEREILQAFGQKKTRGITALTLRYLQSRSKLVNALFRTVIVRWGGGVQWAGAHLAGLVPRSDRLLRAFPLSLFRSAPAPASQHTLRSVLPGCGPDQALLVRPDGEVRRTVFYFPGCGSERLHGEIGEAAIYLLLRTGCQIILPPPFLCCGFPLRANAKTEAYRRTVLANTILFSQIREMLRYLTVDACAVSCGTCLEALRETGADQIFGAPLRDVCSIALKGGLHATLRGTFAYHAPCHDSLEGKAGELLGESVTLQPVPHCCSEAGTLSLSRPDITDAMLKKKEFAFCAYAPPSGTAVCLTNCPSCVSGLGRIRARNFRPEHLAVALARSAGGETWHRDLRRLVENHEPVNF